MSLYIKKNLNKSRGLNAFAILSLSLVHWAAGPHSAGELEPRAPSEPGCGGRAGPAPQEGTEGIVVLQAVLVQVGHMVRGLPGLLPAGQQLVQAGSIAEGSSRV